MEIAMFKCGFYETEITPPIGSDIPGYSGHRYAETIKEKLFVKAVAIKAGPERIESNIIMIVMDALCVPAKVYDTVMEKIERITGIPTKNILIAATHSHTAGPVYPTSEFRVGDDIWLETLAQSSADCGIMAYRNMQNATARIAVGKAEGLGFCRDWVLKDGNIRTNPGWKNPLIDHVFGKNDPEFPVMFILDEENRPMGAITNFACHHDCKAGTEISADYSGILAREMKKAFGMDFVNILFAGACGNINHVNPLRENAKYDRPRYIEIGEALAKEELRLFDVASPFDINTVLSEKRVLPIPRREVTEERLEEAHWLLENVPTDFYQLDIANAENIMFKRCKAESIIAHAALPKNLPAFIQVLRLGDCTWFALPGEVYCEFGLALKEASTTTYTFVSTLSNKGMWGYIPVPEAFGTTIYPAQLPSSPCIPEAGQMMVDYALELAKTMK